MKSFTRCLFLFSLFFWPGFSSTLAGEGPILETGKTVIYYSESCHGCQEYIDEAMIPLLKGLGVREIIKKDYVNIPANRKELFERKQALGVPPELQGHITTFVGEMTILEGHVPSSIIADLMAQGDRAGDARVVIYQDEMKDPTHYRVWVGKGQPRTFPIDFPIVKALEDTRSSPSVADSRGRRLLSAVLVTGLLDGINPCAFAVLLFFIAFLFTMNKTRHSVYRMGITYIAAIYATYFLIGLGLLKAFSISGTPHLMARVGAVLVILLGAIHIKDYFFPNLPITVRVPKVGENVIVKWAYRATFPATLVLGFLVGLCTFPCSGGIYVATIGLLQSQTTYFKGLSYLLLYNLMFVVPLIVILMTASSKVIAGKLLHWERIWKGKMHIFYGAVMIGVGVVILVWFV
jgi:cytochrome c biogenesis protein CcdA